MTKSRFKPGISGNPRGRPRGARNKTTIAAEIILEGEAEAVARKAVDLAIEGNPVAIKLVLDRILPARRGRPISIDLGNLDPSAKGLLDAQARVIRAVSEGLLTTEEAASLASVLESLGNSYERTLLEERLDALEETIYEKKV